MNTILKFQSRICLQDIWSCLNLRFQTVIELKIIHEVRAENHKIQSDQLIIVLLPGRRTRTEQSEYTFFILCDLHFHSSSSLMFIHVKSASNRLEIIKRDVLH